MIECTIEIDIAQRPEDVFAFIDADDKVPQWQTQCVSLDRTSPGEKAVGTTLRYVYRQPIRIGTMTGVVTAYEAGKRLIMKYTDRMFEMSVGFEVLPRLTGSRVIERVSIAPKGRLARWMEPILRRMTKRRTEKEMVNLRRALETPGVT